MGTKASRADVLIDKDLHRLAKAQAATEGRSLKSLMNELVRVYLAEKTEHGAEVES